VVSKKLTLAHSGSKRTSRFAAQLVGVNPFIEAHVDAAVLQFNRAVLDSTLFRRPRIAVAPSAGATLVAVVRMSETQPPSLIACSYCEVRPDDGGFLFRGSHGLSGMYLLDFITMSAPSTTE
jgi:hypothetical protein